MCQTPRGHGCPLRRKRSRQQICRGRARCCQDLLVPSDRRPLRGRCHPLLQLRAGTGSQACQLRRRRQRRQRRLTSHPRLRLRRCRCCRWCPPSLASMRGRPPHLCRRPRKTQALPPLLPSALLVLPCNYSPKRRPPTPCLPSPRRPTHRSPAVLSPIYQHTKSCRTTSCRPTSSVSKSSRLRPPRGAARHIWRVHLPRHQSGPQLHHGG